MVNKALPDQMAQSYLFDLAEETFYGVSSETPFMLREVTKHIFLLNNVGYIVSVLVIE